MPYEGKIRTLQETGWLLGNIALLDGESDEAKGLVSRENHMFKPKYKYTDKIIELLTKIAAAREIILNSSLIPRWEVSLRKDAIIRSAHSSTSIEGNNLSLEQVSELAAGRKIMAKRRDKEEVLNYIKVLEKLDVLAKDGEVTEKTIKNIHQMLTVNTSRRSARLRSLPQ